MTRRAWRIVQTHRAAEAFDGEGARLHGGRWNRPGTRMIYCADSLSLATLEILVNLESGEALQRYVAIPVEFPEEICSVLLPADLPTDWDANPVPPSTQQLGSAWATQEVSAVLSVPSAVIQTERFVLLNPAHPDFERIEIGNETPLEIDERRTER